MASWLDIFKKERERKLLYQRVFDTDDGKRVLVELMEGNFVFSQTTAVDADGRTDSHRTAFNEGRRAVALRILQILDTPLENFRQMYEAQQRIMEEAE